AIKQGRPSGRRDPESLKNDNSLLGGYLSLDGCPAGGEIKTGRISCQSDARATRDQMFSADGDEEHVQKASHSYLSHALIANQLALNLPAHSPTDLDMGR
ncbi:hypothetical protein BaRGS_00024282, partial [Batillaria attramentaria]